MTSIETQLETLSTNSLNIIYADPPWSYNQNVGSPQKKKRLTHPCPFNN